LIRDLPNNLGIATFFDYGNAFDRFGTRLQYSVGVGVRVRLPVLTLGVDIAQPLSSSLRWDVTQQRFLSVRPRSAPAHQLLAQAVAMFSLRRLLLLIACLAVVAAIVAPAALIWSALFTTGGLQFVIRHIPHNIAGVQLDIVGVRGTVADGLAVERVRSITSWCT